MEPKITSLTIERYRMFRRLHIDGLGQVNLVTGKNNTGKSSLLEALRILASNASPSIISNIIRFREEDGGKAEEPMQASAMETLFPLSGLFHGFPSFFSSEPIAISSNGGKRPMRLSLEIAWFTEEREPNGARRLVPSQELFEENEARPALVIHETSNKRVVPLDNYRRYGLTRHPFILNSPDESRLPCVYVSPYCGEDTVALGRLWDEVALTDYEKDVVEALKIIDEKIEAVSMVGDEGPRRTRTAKVRSADIARPVPLRSFGDGLNRLFGIALSLVNAKNGLLLIDEFENGLHHTVQTDIWRVIFKLARRLDIQVMATTHSWDAIEAFQKAASEEPEDGVLVRLTRKGEDIIPTVFSREDLAIATRDRIEVR